MTTTLETESAEQSAATELAVANQTLAEILADPGAATGAQLAAAQADINLAEIKHRAARMAHEEADKRAEAERRDAFTATLASNVVGHNETVRLALEDLAAAVDRALTASRTRQAACAQYRAIASDLGVPFEARGTTVANVDLGSSAQAVATRVSATALPQLFADAGYGHVSVDLEHLARSGIRLP